MRPLACAVKVAQTVANADLRSRIDTTGGDETAQLLTALRTMNERLVAMVNQVRDSSDSIATGQLINEIAGTTGEQRTGIGQVSDAVNQLAEVTQQSAALVEQSAAAAENLKRQADQLAQLVGHFQTA